MKPLQESFIRSIEISIARDTLILRKINEIIEHLNQKESKNTDYIKK